MIRRLIIAVAFVAAGDGATFGTKDLRAPAKAEQPPPAPPSVPVVAAKVVSHDVPIYLRGVGTVIAYNNVIVRSQITGQLIKVSFTQGQTVHKGDLLGEIDPRPYQAQLDQATANRDRDQAQLQNAQVNLQRYVPLESKGYASTQ